MSSCALCPNTLAGRPFSTRTLTHDGTRCRSATIDNSTDVGQVEVFRRRVRSGQCLTQEPSDIYAALAVFTSSCGGLVVSLILKYLDSVAKCIVAAVTMIIMGLTQSILTHQPIPSTVICGIVLITISIEQYSTLTR